MKVRLFRAKDTRSEASGFSGDRWGGGERRSRSPGRLGLSCAGGVDVDDEDDGDDDDDDGSNAEEFASSSYVLRKSFLYMFLKNKGNNF